MSSYKRYNISDLVNSDNETFEESKLVEITGKISNLRIGWKAYYAILSDSTDSIELLYRTHFPYEKERAKKHKKIMKYFIAKSKEIKGSNRECLIKGYFHPISEWNKIPHIIVYTVALLEGKLSLVDEGELTLCNDLEGSLTYTSKENNK